MIGNNNFYNSKIEVRDITMSDKTNMTYRLSFIDNMKAIGIILVVMGHAPCLNIKLENFIFSFHIPLFFFISGFLLSEQKLSLSTKNYLHLQMKRLLIPYLFFFMISYLYWIPTHSMGSKAVLYANLKWYEPIVGMFYGYGEKLIVNVVLWFFPCLFVTAVAYYMMRRFINAISCCYISLIVAFVTTIFYNEPAFRLLWCIDNALVALVFYSCGQFFRIHFNPEHMGFHKYIVSLILLVLTLGLVFINQRVDLNNLSFGIYPILYIPTAFAGILFVFFISCIIPGNYLFKWLSKNTLIIFPLHVLFFSLITGTGVILFGLSHSFKDSSPIFNIAYSLFALLLSCPASILLHRFFPYIFKKQS